MGTLKQEDQAKVYLLNGDARMIENTKDVKFY